MLRKSPVGAPASPRRSLAPRPVSVVGRLTSITVVGSLAAAAAIGGVAAPAAAASGSVSGTVFRDFNSDGVMNPAATASLPAVDVGVEGVTVRAFDSSGSQLDSATTNDDGEYTLSYDAPGAGTSVRVQFEAPEGFTSGPHGSGSGITSGSATQFVEDGDTADFGIVAVGDFSQPNPDVAIAVQRSADADTDASSIARMPYNTGRNTDPGFAGYPQLFPTEATYEQTGTVYGIAAFSESYFFSSAYFRRSAPLGPVGGSLSPDERLGQIYLTESGGAPDATPFVEIPGAGTNPRPAGADSRALGSYDWSHDGATDADAQATVAAPGTIGLGDIDTADDASALYAVNLADRQLYRVPLAPVVSGAAPVAAGAPVAIPMPLDLPGADEGCAQDQVRPFGLDSVGTSIYATLTCTGPTQADLRTYLYLYDGSDWESAPSFEMSLQYPRGGLAETGIPDSTWQVWNDVYDTVAVTPQPSGGVYAYADPQPVASDIEFAPNGDLTISFRDRGVDQAGLQRPIVSETAVAVQSFAAGDILRACGPVGGPWTLESNGSCGGVTAIPGTGPGETNGPGNSQGPGGGEFYLDSFRAHEQTSLGATEQIPGFTDFISVQYDVEQLGYSGWRRLSHATGTGIGPMIALGDTVAAGLLDPVTGAPLGGTFLKGGNLGDLESLLADAPLEIGNRVWLDADGDGVQDGTDAERPIEGVTVHLYDSADTLVGTAVTDANGEYYFNDSNVTGGLQPNTDYRIAIDDASDFASGGPLFGLLSTTPDAGSDDSADSDGIPDSQGILPEVSITTRALGDNDHTFDFGFVPPSVSVGDYVWVDEDRDGQQGSGEPGIPGVTLVLTGPDGNPVTDVLGNPVGPTVTDSDGLYSFDLLPTLPAGDHYTVTIDQTASASALAPYVPTRANVGAPATDSSTGSAESVDLTENGDRDPTLDFGFLRRVYAVGDYVWFDEDRDGRQDSSEEPVQSLSVTLYRSDGTRARDWNGDLIPVAITDKEGHYVFDGLLPGEYYAVFSLPPGYTFTTTGSGGGTDSNPASNGKTPVFSVGPGEDDMRDVRSSDGTLVAVQINPTIDAGIVRERPDLAYTGGEIATTLVGFAAILLATGVAAVLAGRRRRSH